MHGHAHNLDQRALAGARRSKQTPIDGKAVRFFRIQAGMSQVTLGGELGVTFQQIQKYEKGLDRHWLRAPAEIAKLFNRPVTAFYPKRTTDGTVNINEIIALTDRPQNDADAVQQIQNPRVRLLMANLAEVFVKTRTRGG